MKYALLKSLKSNHGMALFMSIMIIIVVTVLLGVMVTAINNEFRLMAGAERTITAKYVAEAGVEHGFAEAITRINDVVVYTSDDIEGVDNVTISFSDVNGPFTDIIIVDGQTIGEYEVVISIDNDSEVLDFVWNEIVDDTYSSMPLGDRRVNVTSVAQVNGRTYTIEASLVYDISYNNDGEGEVAWTAISSWQETQ